MGKPIKLKFNKRRLSGFSGNQLKLIAFFLMLCDHIGYMLIENGVLYGQNPMYWTMALETPEGQRWFFAAQLLRTVGRIAFPLFAFTTVEGYIHTRSVRKYFTRLLLCALISEVPFDLACRGVAWYPEYQNVVFTLVLGTAALFLVDKYRKHAVIQFLSIFIMCIAAYYLKSDYGAAGVLLMSVLYMLRNEKNGQILMGAATSALESYEYFGISALAFLFIRFYNGKRGDFSLKYFFYVMYPLHLLVFWMLVRFSN